MSFIFISLVMSSGLSMNLNLQTRTIMFSDVWNKW